jgi:preprotein translocase subunit SecY
MNIEEISKQLAEQRILIDKIYESTEKTRKYFLWSLIITLVFLIGPIIVGVVALPFLMSSISALTGTGLGI